MLCSLCDVYVISHSQPEHDKRVYKNMIQSVETLATALKKVFDLLNIYKQTPYNFEAGVRISASAYLISENA